MTALIVILALISIVFVFILIVGFLSKSHESRLINSLSEFSSWLRTSEYKDFHTNKDHFEKHLRKAFALNKSGAFTEKAIIQEASQKPNHYVDEHVRDKIEDEHTSPTSRFKHFNSREKRQRVVVLAKKYLSDKPLRRRNKSRVSRCRH
ncbi:MAG: hypothetical protein V1838_05630 [Patescibacteria group bacterium]